MTKEQIQAAIPHRAPMLLIDEIVEISDSVIVCKKTFTAEEFFVQGHYPDFPIVPGVILIESCCQAGAVLVSKAMESDSSGKVPVLTRVDKAKFKKMVRPGDTVELHAEIRDQVSGAIFLSGKVTVDGALSVRFDFACSLADTTAE